MHYNAIFIKRGVKMITKTCLNFPKFYVCKYGAFYEGERLAEYCWTSGDHYYYSKDVVVEKFFFHYYNYVPTMYFRYREVGSKKTFSLPCEGYLGILYRKYKKRY